MKNYIKPVMNISEVKTAQNIASLVDWLHYPDYAGVSITTYTFES